MGQKEQEKLMNPRELSHYLGLSVVTIYKKVANKSLPHIKIGRKAIRFRKSDIDSWLNTKCITK